MRQTHVAGERLFVDCFYEPAVNRTYAEMAAHYDTAVVPARPNKPRDKAKVEVAVQVATRWPYPSGCAARCSSHTSCSVTPGRLIIGAHFEPDDTVDLIAFGGQHDDRNVKLSAKPSAVRAADVAVPSNLNDPNRIT